jgi:transcription-repair coupling factor (superfamily II helicase)
LAEEYLPDVDRRVLAYRRLASAAELSEVDALQIELEERYGGMPLAARNLFDRARLRIRAERLGVASVALVSGRLIYQGIELPRDVALRFRSRRAIYYPKTNKLAYPFHRGEEEVMPAALGVLEEVGGHDDTDDE